LEGSRDAAVALPTQLYLTWYDSDANPRVDTATDTLRDAVRDIRTAVDVALEELQRLYGAIASQQTTINSLGARQQTLTTQLSDLRALQNAAPPSSSSSPVLVSGRFS
jgi:hypothetical protein